jgi:hypothetical protein
MQQRIGPQIMTMRRLTRTMVTIIVVSGGELLVSLAELAEEVNVGIELEATYCDSDSAIVTFAAA